MYTIVTDGRWLDCGSMYIFRAVLPLTVLLRNWNSCQAAAPHDCASHAISIHVWRMRESPTRQILLPRGRHEPPPPHDVMPRQVGSVLPVGRATSVSQLTCVPARRSSQRACAAAAAGLCHLTDGEAHGTFESTMSDELANWFHPDASGMQISSIMWTNEHRWSWWRWSRGAVKGCTKSASLISVQLYNINVIRNLNLITYGQGRRGPQARLALVQPARRPQ